MKELKIKLKGKEINFKLKEMKGINKLLGLMFYRDNLLFEFNQGKSSIHSFFCPKFIAIWLNDGKIVDIAQVEKWKFSIKPEKEFNKLIEIPILHRNYEIVKPILDFLDGLRKV